MASSLVSTAAQPPQLRRQTVAQYLLEQPLHTHLFATVLAEKLISKKMVKICNAVVGLSLRKFTKGGVVFVDYCSATVDGAPPAINPTSGVDKSTINALNPLMIAGSTQSTQLSTPGGIVSRMLSFIFPLAGLILFVMITWGGFEMILGATNGQKGLEAGKNRVTSAIVGFILLFCTYWLAQILEVVFGIKIL